MATRQLSGLFLEVISPLIYFQSVIFWQCSPEAILDNEVLIITWFNWTCGQRSSRTARTGFSDTERCLSTWMPKARTLLSSVKSGAGKCEPIRLLRVNTAHEKYALYPKTGAHVLPVLYQLPTCLWAFKPNNVFCMEDLKILWWMTHWKNRIFRLMSSWQVAVCVFKDDQVEYFLF